METQFVSMIGKEPFVTSFQKNNRTDKDVQINALKRYLTTEDKDLIKLMQYAQLFKVDRDLRKYMEVLV